MMDNYPHPDPDPLGSIKIGGAGWRKNVARRRARRVVGLLGFEKGAEKAFNYRNLTECLT